MVKTPPSNAGGGGLIPGGETKIPHATWYGHKKTKQNGPVTAPQCRRNQVRLCESVKSGTNRRNECEIVMTGKFT